MKNNHNRKVSVEDENFCILSGTLSVEEVYKDRDQFATLVREVAAPDVGRMGIEILSFTIKDVYDDVQYLASLGKAQTAVVKRDADVGVAEANRDAGIRVCSHTIIWRTVYRVTREKNLQLELLFLNLVKSCEKIQRCKVSSFFYF